jgi:hypothetical protein
MTPERNIYDSAASNPPTLATDQELADAIFGLKRKTLIRKITLLEEQIRQRQISLEENINSIEQDICLCSNTAFQLHEDDIQNQHRILLRYKIPLFREKRQQKTEHLRDITQLQRELIDTTLQYLAMFDKQKLLQ